MSTITTSACNLCGAPNATDRPGRLGRYARTCERCEERRGSHLGDTTGQQRVVDPQTLASLQRRTGLANRNR